MLYIIHSIHKTETAADSNRDIILKNILKHE